MLRLKEWLLEELPLPRADVALLIASFGTAIVDAMTFPTMGVFVANMVSIFKSANECWELQMFRGWTLGRVGRLGSLSEAPATPTLSDAPGFDFVRRAMSVGVKLLC